ncbi:MAG: Drug/metabolite transporter permease superfamily protein [Panacagrimonas sp.]|jgi:drug/metabolite transporter (DMT)-like permease|nr:DMT family transporter [Panacagrimonas sp.]MCC2657890.1 Drug/metabolite transporter permease superfamily protein [Panacagrimonas sp.]
MLRAVWSTPALLLIVSTLCWSGNFVLGRAMHEHVPPIGLAFWRWTGALLLVVGFAAPHLRRDWTALWTEPLRLVLLSFLGVASFNSLVYLGLNTTTATNAVLLQSVMPLMIFLASYAIYREAVQPVQVIALAISLVGVTTIISHGSMAALLSLSLRPGDGWVLLAVVFYALYSVLLRRRPQVHPLSFLAATFALGALMLLPVYLAEHLAVRRIQVDGPTLASIVYVAIFPSVVAYLCFNRAVELAGPNRAGQYLHLMPVFGSALAALFVGERLAWFHWAGAGLIACGILLARKRTP